MLTYMRNEYLNMNLKLKWKVNAKEETGTVGGSLLIAL